MSKYDIVREMGEMDSYRLCNLVERLLDSPDYKEDDYTDMVKDIIFKYYDSSKISDYQLKSLKLHVFDHQDEF